MVTRRTAKNKGSQMEMDTEYSLKKVYPHMRRLGGEGQYREIDLIDDVEDIAVECKFHSGFSWNELKKYYDKLCDRAPEGYDCNLIFKANRQPVLVMHEDWDKGLIIQLFEDVFKTEFEKHVPIKKEVKKK